MQNRIKRAAIIAAMTFIPVALWAQAGTTFLGPRVWTDAAPAAYLLQLEGTSLCAERTTGGTIFRRPYLSLKTCNAGLFGQILQFAPKGVAPPPVPLTSPVRWRVTSADECASVARNVVVGPPAVDMLACDLPAEAGGDTALRGGSDQSFIMVMRGPNRLSMRYSDGRCWTVQDNVRAVGTQLVMEPCDGRPSQTFKLIFDGDIHDQRSAERFGWLLPPAGTTLEGATALRFRSMPALDLIGHDYDAGRTSTPNDQGAACARRCMEDNRCRAFTWVDPRFTGGAAKCFVKDAIAEPTDNPMTNSGIVRP